MSLDMVMPIWSGSCCSSAGDVGVVEDVDMCCFIAGGVANVEFVEDVEDVEGR